jgi:precorrin-8X/cobalt-precorrin-8 methylmutase
MRTAVIVVAHGSRLKEANHGLYEIVDSLRATGRWAVVEPCFLQFQEPDLTRAVDKAITQGAQKVVITPVLLFPGNHLQKDIPQEIEGQRARYPDVEFILTRHLGIDHRTAQMVIERIEEATLEDKIPPGPDRPLKPKEIEEESFRIIDKLVDLSPFPADFRPIVRRVIHTTGDPEFSKTITFHPEAVAAGLKALREGRPIITDVAMVKTGIDKKLLSHFGVKIICNISSPRVRREAEVSGNTRAATALRASVSSISTGGIIAIGNAPTALREAIRLVKEGEAHPALVIGVPVGFVGAKEAKMELEGLPLPFITNRGMKGGSTVAVAIVNALLRMANEKGHG